MLWNQIEVLEVKIPKKIAKSHCLILCPFLSFEDEISKTEHLQF